MDNYERNNNLDFLKAFTTYNPPERLTAEDIAEIERLLDEMERLGY